LRYHARISPLLDAPHNPKTTLLPTMPLRFHWMLPKSNELEMTSVAAAARFRVESLSEGSPAAVPELPGWLRFGRHAEQAGIDSVLIAFSRYEPDPLLIACALGQGLARLGFIIAVRTGLVAPTLLVQQVNTLAGLIGGRVSLNLVAGSSRMEQRGYGDFLPHDERYARAEEFLAICAAVWRRGPNQPGVDFAGRHSRVEGAELRTPFVAPGRTAPEIHVSGHSEVAERLAACGASCWTRVIDTPEALRDPIARARAHGLEVCLRLCVICRPTRDEALSVIDELLADPVVTGSDRAARDDSQMYREALERQASWLDDRLWAGLAAVRGPVWTTLVGTPDEVAAALLEYGRLGVTQFILSGWPELDEVERFGREVIPRVRAAEAA
jgi:alkanesulfonate monooxygenase